MSYLRKAVGLYILTFLAVAGLRAQSFDDGVGDSVVMPGQTYEGASDSVQVAVSLPVVAFPGTVSVPPTIDPIANVTIPAGKSLILPVTATSPSGRPLTYTVVSSTNAIAVVQHTNNPFWQLTVAQAAPTNAPGAYLTPYRGGLATVTNVGTLTFMLFPEYAPHTINVFQGLTESGFYNSNTIFHRVISDFVIQGGDPLTNGSGGLVFEYDDEFNPQAIFSGNGQLGLANSGPNTDGCQFFVTVGAQRSLDFDYPLFGQLVRGFGVLTNIDSTETDTNSRPLADEIIQTAGDVTNTTDTVLTLTAASTVHPVLSTNVSAVASTNGSGVVTTTNVTTVVTNFVGLTGTITVIASDGNGGFATTTFTATTVYDTNSNHQPVIFPNTVTNLVGPVNTTLTDFISAVELDGDELYWYPEFVDQTSQEAASGSSLNTLNNGYQTLTYNVTNVDGKLQLFIKPATGYVGPVNLYFPVSADSEAELYWEYGYSPSYLAYQTNTFIFGDTPIVGQTNTVTALAGVPFYNLLLATFTNGVPASAATNFTATINWGDDSITNGTVTTNALGIKGVLGSHTYAWPGSYPVYVRVQSAIGASATLVSRVNVINPTATTTNLLTVRVNGRATVSPGYTNAPLAVGESYTLIASPTNFWVVSAWTDENGFDLGSATNFNFTMTPGLSLTANIVAATTPLLYVVSPLTGQLITNLYSALPTISGTVWDNATVTSVWYQVNAGGWTNATGTTAWSASFTPAYGQTNVLQTYAVNEFGYRSPTNTLRVKYLAGAVLALNTSNSASGTSANSYGYLLTNLNGELLPLGSNYVVKAVPTNGFAFTGWTGSASTTNPALSFTMTTNSSFTANFRDVTPPTNVIANLVSGQQVSNNVFTVSGTASDNWEVAGVNYRINQSGWSNATGTTAWTAALNLTANSNEFQAYAYDTAGNHSKTNTVWFKYVVSAQVQLGMTGLGTITPAYNSNTWLQVGLKYTLTAQATNGFSFTGWTGTWNTNNLALTFTVASNLAFTANFADVTPPTLSLTNPVNGQAFSTNKVTVLGNAGDNWQLVGVNYQLNSSGWTNATNWSATLNLTTNHWSVHLTLAPGTNVVQAYAYDSAGNHSKTNTVTVDYGVSAPLTLVTNGSGTISASFTSDLLQVGRNYSVTAVPAKGWLFHNWTTNGRLNAATNQPTLIFAMSSNLVLTANFYQPPTILVQPANVVAFYGGNANFTVSAADSQPITFQWQHNSTNLSGQVNSTLPLTGLTANQAGNYRVIVTTYSSSVTSSVAKLTLSSAPDSFAGLVAVVTPAGKAPFEASFGTNTFSQFPLDTNLENSVAGGYGYVASGAVTGLLSLTNQLPPDAVSNVTEVVDVTFVSPGLASFTSGAEAAGTIQYYTATNLAPNSWTNHTLTLISTNSAETNLLSLKSPGLYSDADDTGASTNNIAGRFTAAAYSPVAAWFRFDPTNTPAPTWGPPVTYVQLQFTSLTNGNYILEQIQYTPSEPISGNSDLSSDLEEEQQGRFIWK
jgi:uncharacterized repeat protein (TIGR02543 family)